MNTRLSQDAADTLHAYEAQQAFRERERARWARAQPPKIVGRVVFPELTQQEHIEREQQINEGLIPF
jgi:hypothetical protein